MTAARGVSPAAISLQMGPSRRAFGDSIVADANVVADIVEWPRVNVDNDFRAQLFLFRYDAFRYFTGGFVGRRGASWLRAEVADDAAGAEMSRGVSRYAGMPARCLSHAESTGRCRCANRVPPTMRCARRRRRGPALFAEAIERHRHRSMTSGRGSFFALDHATR